MASRMASRMASCTPPCITHRALHTVHHTVHHITHHIVHGTSAWRRACSLRSLSELRGLSPLHSRHSAMRPSGVAAMAENWPMEVTPCSCSRAT
eukprot:scaffold17668_cov64-Phaeocystis_antarctica.AAC.5